jgi:hypothetical protein
LSHNTTEGKVGLFDVLTYLHNEAFKELRDIAEFMKIVNGG